MTTTAGTRLNALLTLLIVAVVESFIHYLDNTARFSQYRGPHPPTLTAWIARWMIPASWVLFTAAAWIGYRRFKEQRWPQAAAWLGAYSASGLISFAHYLGVSVSDLSAFQNTFVFLDIALGIVILGYAVWIAFVLAGRPENDRLLRT